MVVRGGGGAAGSSPDRRVTEHNAIQKTQNVYDAILARSKRSRMEKQPNAYASAHMPINEYSQEYKLKQQEILKQKKV